MNVPDNLKYTKTHEWVRLEGGTATVGITDHAQSELGDIVYIELPTVGRVLQRDQSFGTIESVKTVSDLYAPLDGEIVEVNEALAARSELLNSDPYGQGWVAKIRLTGSEPTLLEPADYKKSIEG